MRFLFCVFLLSGVLQVSAQSETRQSIQSKAKTVLVELASLNQLTLKNSEKEREFILSYNNHTTYKAPIVSEKDNMVAIKVTEAKDFLPGSQRNKYRAGQPLYPNYTIEIPENVEVKIVYKKGNFKANNFSGTLALYLDHGIVDILGINGSVFVQSYAGVINCKLKNATITVESSKGSIISEIQDDKLVANTTSLQGIYGYPLNKLQIKTVTAKVNLQPLVDK